MSKEISIVKYENGFSVTVPATAVAAKNQALAVAKPIVKVTNGDEQTAAISAVAVIKGLISGTESTREEIKKPYLDAGRAIDAKAKEYVKELNEEADRIQRLVGAFQRMEAEKAEQARREQERQQREAEMAEQRERDRLTKIESDRLAAEQAAANARTKKAREAAAAEAERLRREQAEAELAVSEAADDLATANAVVVMPEAPRATGAAVTFGTDFEVTDIEAIYQWDLARRQKMAKALGKPLANFPPLVKLEIKKSDFKYITSCLSEDERDSIPGVKFFATTKAAVRGVTPTL